MLIAATHVHDRLLLLLMVRRGERACLLKQLACRLFLIARPLDEFCGHFHPRVGTNTTLCLTSPFFLFLHFDGEETIAATLRIGTRVFSLVAINRKMMIR